MKKSATVSIILPFYKQNDHASSTILDCIKEMRVLDVPFEIIAVYNGIQSLSSEKEKMPLETHLTPVTQISLKKDGWGYAVKTGLREAQGDFICYTNSARTDMKELAKLIRYALLSDEYIVKATRILRDTCTRKWVSRLYNLANRTILATPIWDVNATPKIFPRKILDRLGSIQSDGDSIDAEILYIAHRKEIPVIEIPSNHLPRRGGSSTTKLVSSGIKMFCDLFKIRMKI